VEGKGENRRTLSGRHGTIRGKSKLPRGRSVLPRGGSTPRRRESRLFPALKKERLQRSACSIISESWQRGMKLVSLDRGQTDGQPSPRVEEDEKKRKSSSIAFLLALEKKKG